MSATDSCPRKLRLGLTQRNAEPGHPMVLRRVDQKSTPTATDIKQPLTRAQAQLAACVVQLLFLRTIQVDAGRLEIRTRIHQTFVEKQPEKVVGDVVVISDRLSVSLPRMLATLKLDRSPPHSLAACARHPQQKRPQTNLSSPAEVRLHEERSQRKQSFHVAFNIDVAVRISFA